MLEAGRVLVKPTVQFREEVMLPPELFVLGDSHRLSQVNFPRRHSLLSIIEILSFVPQVMMNFLSNAAKFTSEGEILFTARIGTSKKIERNEKEKGRHGCEGADETVQVTFTVKDTGIGMDQETIARLFKPYHQADSSISRRFGGTGLGLSIAKQLVDKMGGSILVQSQPDIGTTFTVYASPLTPLLHCFAFVVALPCIVFISSHVDISGLRRGHKSSCSPTDGTLSVILRALESAQAPYLSMLLPFDLFSILY